MRLLLIFALFATFANHAFAQTIRVGGQKDCVPAQHRPADDVAYKEGVDAKGWALQPADLNSSSQAVEDLNNPSINLEMPLEPYVNHPKSNNDLSESKLQFGEIKVQDDNSVTLNGHSLNASPSEVSCE